MPQSQVYSPIQERNHRLNDQEEEGHADFEGTQGFKEFGDAGNGHSQECSQETQESQVLR